MRRLGSGVRALDRQADRQQGTHKRRAPRSSVGAPCRRSSMAKYILSDPNFSAGRDNKIVEQIVAQVRDRQGVKLIGYEPDPDFDRLPIELLGRPEAMMETILAAAAKAYELIDMEKQHGHHPRIGAVDTIEIYPAKDITIEECKAFAEELGKELFKRHEVPIYFTGKNARRPEHEGLTVIRKGNYEGLRDAVLTDPNRAPDIGPAKLHPTAGATIVGALERSEEHTSELQSLMR